MSQPVEIEQRVAAVIVIAAILLSTAIALGFGISRASASAAGPVVESEPVETIIESDSPEEEADEEDEIEAHEAQPGQGAAR